MTFDWRDYLDVATELMSPRLDGGAASDEARQRAAISRAYYAVFGSLVREHLKSGRGGRGNPHQALVDALTVSPDPGATRLAGQLSRLRVLRNQCDYDDLVPELQATCFRVLRETSAILGR